MMIDDDKLVALWHEPDSCPVIAVRNGVGQVWLTLAWRRLQRRGLIPTDRRRNASQTFADETNDGSDGRPSIKTRDRLLKRLHAVHSERRPTKEAA